MVGPAPQVVSLLIGTNDLGSQSIRPSRILEGIEFVLGMLLAWGPNVRIVLHALFPRTDDLCKRHKLHHSKLKWCPQFTLDVQRSAFNEQINKINMGIRRIAADKPRVMFFDCAHEFIEKKNGRQYLKYAMFKADALHPSFIQGAEAMVGCMRTPLERLLRT